MCGQARRAGWSYERALAYSLQGAWRSGRRRTMRSILAPIGPCPCSSPARCLPRRVGPRLLTGGEGRATPLPFQEFVTEPGFAMVTRRRPTIVDQGPYRRQSGCLRETNTSPLEPGGLVSLYRVESVASAH